MEEDKNKTDADDIEDTEDSELDDDKFDSEFDELFNNDSDDDEDEDEIDDEFDDKKLNTKSKNSKDFIISRMRKRIEKLEKGTSKNGSDDRIAKIAEQLEGEKIDRSIDKVVDEMEIPKVVEAKLRKLAHHKDYKAIPIKGLARMLVHEYGEKHTTKQTAEDRAKQSRDGGSTARSTVKSSGNVDYSKMSREEILKISKNAGKNLSY
ncbi:MAG: hypothetical protein ACRCX2_10460 [Paraclostridium sp.]